MSSAAYESWIYLQLEPEAMPQSGRYRREYKEPDGWIDPIQAAENYALINMKQVEREEADRVHLERHGIYF